MMQKFSIRVSNEYDLKLLRRAARYHHHSVPMMIRILMEMSLKTLRTEERVGIHHGPAPRLPKLKADPGPFEGWSKADRDRYIMTGERPGNDQEIPASLKSASSTGQSQQRKSGISQE